MWRWAAAIDVIGTIESITGTSAPVAKPGKISAESFVRDRQSDRRAPLPGIIFAVNVECGQIRRDPFP